MAKEKTKGSLPALNRDVMILAVVALVLINLFVFVILKLFQQEERHIKTVKSIEVGRPTGATTKERSNEADRAVRIFVDNNPHSTKAKFSQYELTEASLNHIARLKKLRNLDISFTNIGDDGLSRITRLPIRTLNLSHTKISDRGVQNLQSVKTLNTLNLSGTRVTDACFKPLKGLTRIAALNLEGTAITDAGIAKLCSGNKRLALLNISRTEVTNNCISSLAKLRRLSGLSADETRITCSGLAPLAGRKLKQLNLVSCDVTDSDVTKLVRMFPGMMFLNLSDTGISDRSLSQLSRLGHLKSLKLRSCPGLTKKQIASFKKQRPGCKVVDSIELDKFKNVW